MRGVGLTLVVLTLAAGSSAARAGSITDDIELARQNQLSEQLKVLFDPPAAIPVNIDDRLNLEVRKANADVEARNTAIRILYEGAVADYVQAKADYEAMVARQQNQMADYGAAVARWKNQVAACGAGDRKGCVGDTP